MSKSKKSNQDTLRAKLEVIKKLESARTGIIGSGSHYYDREGKSIELLKWAELIENPEYKIVKQTIIDDRLEVSTVWIGLNSFIYYDEGLPVIFETMVFNIEDKKESDEGYYGDALIQEKYSTEKKALEGHTRLVKEYSRGCIYTRELKGGKSSA